MKSVNLRPHLKRNILIAAVLLLVCAAAFLNWSYNQRWGDGNSAMADAEDEMTTAGNAAGGSPEAACAESASQEVIDSAMNEITVMANWSLLESKIENELLAKDFADCVVYLSSQGCTVAVPSGADGLTETQVAQITDAVLSNTELTAAAINVIEVRN